jgi:CheY-like chemotaxis protein
MPTRAKHILIVEDDPFIALDMQEHFISRGHTVAGPARTVAEAVSIIESEAVDCASLDYNLGNETCAPIAIQLRERHVPFVFVTGNAQRLLQEANLPNAPVIGKPFQYDRVMQALGLAADRG